MEKNTFATSIYVATRPEDAFAYLRQLENLSEWTLGSRMVERIDDDTWMGTASGYQSALCYHVRTLSDTGIRAIEWQCGYTYQNYFKQYPLLIFPADYLEPGSHESGCYLHWVSVIDPARRTPMIMEGISTVHLFEARSLKAALERRQGLQEPATGRYELETDTIFIDAPMTTAIDFVADVRNLSKWSPLFREQGDASHDGGTYQDEYNHRVEVQFKMHPLSADYVLVEQNFHYPDSGYLQRCLFLLIPSERAFGAHAQGMLLHRIAFWRKDSPNKRGRQRIEDFGAENMACKRLIEMLAGNPHSFAKGMSYQGEDDVSLVSASSVGAPPNIFSPEFFQDPYPFYRSMRDDYPLYFDFQTRAWILSRYEDVRAALQNPAFTTRSYASQTEPLLGKTIIQLDGQEHTRQRNLIAASFSAGNVRARYEALITRTVDALIADFHARGKAELMSEFITQFPVRIMAGILGLPTADLDRFRVWYIALIRGALNLSGDPAIASAAVKARDELAEYLRVIITQRRIQPGEDMLSGLVSAELEGERLSDEEIIRFGMLMVFAAGETTEKALATTIRNLIAHPDQLEKVRANRNLVQNSISESLRFTAPTHMVPRKTNAEITVSGGVIPAEAEVMCFLGAANRDERQFPEPDIFNILRPEHDVALTAAAQGMHLAFGAGRHFCPGAMLSKLELEISLNRLLDTLDNLQFAAVQVPPDEGLFLRGPTQLAITFTPRS
jgi:pulcherriminic acid synthase